MSKENEKFLSLYRTYEGLLRARGVDYREVEGDSGTTRMTIMRQMRNYLVHAEDPGFVAISPMCIKILEQMIKEETQRGDIVKNHLVTPAKGSVKEGTPLSTVIYRMVTLDVREIPVYDEKKFLKGLITLEKAAAVMDKKGNIPLGEKDCGPYSQAYTLTKPDILISELRTGNGYICCTKDATLDTQYLGYLDT